jgi:hypothetical protein
MAAITAEGRETDLPGSEISEFASRLQGARIWPDDGSHQPPRQIWDGMVEDRAALVARCAGAEDVAAAVNSARDRRPA